MSIDEWIRWLIGLLMSEGGPSILREETIKAQAGQNYHVNLDYAIKLLMDKGIITQLQSEGHKKYHINFDKIEEARRIFNQPIPKEKLEIAQPYLPEPKNYSYWFDGKERRTFRKQNTYRIFKHKTGERSYVVQLLGKSTRVPTNYHTGSVDDPTSYISRVIAAMQDSSKENPDGTFILQNLQDRDARATGGNRQRGKGIILICEKLGIIEYVEMRGISAAYRFYGASKPRRIQTLDYYTPEANVNMENFSDPEYFEEDKATLNSTTKPDSDLEGKTV